MATITDTDFEGTYPPPGYTEGGTIANVDTSTVQKNSGATSMRVNNTGGAAQAYIFDTVAGKTFISRFYFYIATGVSALANIAIWDNANGAVYLRLLTSTNVIRLTLGTTNYAGPTLSTGQWYRIDIRVDCTGANMVVDWQVDGSAQTQRTRAQTSADITETSIGVITSVTADLFFDDLKVTDTSGDYPLGALPVTRVPRRSPYSQLLAH